MWVGGEFMEYVRRWMVACESWTLPLCSTGQLTNWLMACVQSVSKRNWKGSLPSALFSSNRLTQSNGEMFPLHGFKTPKKRLHQAGICHGSPMSMWMSWPLPSLLMRFSLPMITGSRTPCRRFNDPQNRLEQLGQNRCGVGNYDAPAAEQQAQCLRMSTVPRKVLWPTAMCVDLR